jgi:protein-disulfide isomerase
MGNTSKKHRNKKLTRIGLVILVVVLVGSFIISQSDRKVDPATFADVETFAIESRVKGNPESDISLVKYSDFQCPACAQAYPVVQGLVEDLGDQFKFEYRHFPLRSIHPNAQLAAQAAEAAGVQGKFWEMHDLLFERQQDWSRSLNPKKVFTEYAQELELNPDRFEFDLESDEVKTKVNNEADEAATLGLRGTPTFLVNGEVATLEDLINLLDLSAFEE